MTSFHEEMDLLDAWTESSDDDGDRNQSVDRDDRMDSVAEEALLKTKRGVSSGRDQSHESTHRSANAVDDDDDDDEIPTEVILKRIEDLAAKMKKDLDNGILPLLTLSHDMIPSSNCTTSPSKTRATTSATAKTKSLANMRQCRSYTSILLVMAYCHSLLQSERTVTIREVYYFYVTHFRNQRECDQAIWDVCHVLQVPRHALGLVAGSRGWLCGDVRLVVNNSVNHGTETNVASSQGESVATMVWDGSKYDGDHGHAISSDWLLPARRRPFVVSTVTTATSILVIEKEGIYQRLVQDGFCREHNCILVTGKGFPDLATRAAVHSLHHVLRLPVRGLADCDPFGVLVLHCYSQGATGGRSGRPVASKNRADSNEAIHRVDGRGDRYGVPVAWLGLRPSQIRHLHPDPNKPKGSAHSAHSFGKHTLPNEVFQQLTDTDRQRLNDHLLIETHKFTAAHPRRLAELHDMMEAKVELEALHWLGMDFCGAFVGKLLQHHNEQQIRRQQDGEDSGAVENAHDEGWMDLI